MRLALIGYGKMGKVIESLAMERGHSISFKIDLDNQEKITTLNPDNTDVAIEFTRPESAFDNITGCLHQGVRVISGTTGWLERYGEITELCEKQQGTFLYSSNFSLGVNLFFELNRWLSKAISQFKEYHPEMEEIHHTEKLDKPSGTAISLAEGIIETHEAIDRWELGKNNDQRTISIESKRIDRVPGTHQITYTSEMDSIEIKHTAHSRQGFALGVVKVAEWIADKKGVYTMNDYLKF